MYPNIITNSFIKYVVTVFFLHEGGVECQFLCTSPGICPPHKPYCTTSGCVFECPKSAYVNGTECVAGCGNHLVFNKTCVDHCPIYMNLRETPKLLGKEIYIEKLCVTSCESHEYIYNGTCVKACPLTHRYIHGSNCSTSCPQMAPLIKNVTLYALSYQTCVKYCEYIIENGFCTDKCSPNKLIFNSSCINQCPSSNPFIFNQHCETKCPEQTVLFGNNTCLTRCPIDAPYISYNRCVNICPKESANIVTEHGISHCSKECQQNMFYHNFTCVEHCPSGMVVDNRTCSTMCSKDRPYTCLFQNNNSCGVDIHGVLPNQTVCQGKCPKMYTFNMTCVSTCPFGFKLKNNAWTCLDNCNHGFYYNRKCHSECPTNRIVYKGTCIANCPDGFIWWFQECSRRSGVIIRSAITFGIDMILFFLWRKVLREYFAFLFLAMCMEILQMQHEKNKYAKTTDELQGCVNIEMIQTTTF